MGKIKQFLKLCWRYCYEKNFGFDFCITLVLTCFTALLGCGGNEITELPFNATVYHEFWILGSPKPLSEYFQESFEEEIYTEWMEVRLFQSGKTYFIKDDQAYSSVFSTECDINFDKEMLVIYVYLTTATRSPNITELKQEDNRLIVRGEREKDSFFKRLFKRKKDTGSLKPWLIIIKMDLIDVDEVVFYS